MRASMEWFIILLNVQAVSMVQHLDELYLMDFTKLRPNFADDRLR